MQVSFGRSPGMGAATPRQPRRSVKDQVSSYASSSDADSSEPLPPLLARAAESDPALTRLDLCFNKQFVVLSGQQKLQALEQLARGSALESVRLDGLGLDNTHGATLARLLRHDEHDGSGGVRTLSLQSNALGEPALLALAQAVSGHPSLSELAVARTTRTPGSQTGARASLLLTRVRARLGQVGNQRDALSTLAVATLLDAMATAPRLTRLKLGPVRDEVQRRRHQLLTMEAVERARRERAASPAPGRRERREASPEPQRSTELQRRAAAAASR